MTTLTKDPWYGAVEEALWGWSFLCLIPCVLWLMHELLYFDPATVRAQFIDLGTTKTFLGILLVVSLVLSAYNLTYHVPMLFELAEKERSMGKRFHAVLEGLQSSLFERDCSSRFVRWKRTWDWQLAYFTFGAWFSMFMGMPPRIHVKYLHNN